MRYTWPFYWHLIRFLPWLAVLVLWARPRNRGLGLWRIVAPAFLIQIALFAAEIAWISMAGFALDMAAAMAFSLTVLWLSSQRLLSGSGRNAAGTAIALLIGAGLGYVICAMGLPPGVSALALMIVHALASISIVLAFVIARRGCRAIDTSWRFHILLLIALVGLCLVPTPFLVILAFLEGLAVGDITFLAALLGTAVVALGLTGVAMYVLLALYLAITRRKPELYSRFLAILRLGEPEPNVEIPPFAGEMPEGKESV